MTRAPNPALRPALFLDRDGVINVDRNFVYRLEDFEWLPGIFDLARTAARREVPIVVVTNQSGIGRGYYSQADFLTLTAAMRRRFEAEGAPITAIYHCPFHPEAEEERYRHPDHPWRKPHPGMILAARDELDIDLLASVMIGDRLADLQAGHSAGVGSLALIGSVDLAPAGLPPFPRFATPAEAVPWLEARFAKPASATASTLRQATLNP